MPLALGVFHDRGTARVIRVRPSHLLGPAGERFSLCKAETLGVKDAGHDGGGRGSDAECLRHGLQPVDTARGAAFVELPGA
jgi:hypothetical protein